MDALAGLSFPAAAAWCFGLTIVSAIVPWVNAEVIVLALPAVAKTDLALAALVVIATVGQMVGKCVIYWTARRGSRLPSPRMQERLAAWRTWLERRPWAQPALVLVSSSVGLPPFYLITMLAGALRMNFALFVIIGTIGRLGRFGGLVLGASAIFDRL